MTIQKAQKVLQSFVDDIRESKDGKNHSLYIKRKEIEAIFVVSEFLDMIFRKE